LWWRRELSLKDAYVLPGVIGWILKLVNAVLIFKVKLVASLEGAIGAVGKLVGFAVDFLIASGIREILSLCDILRHVANQAHHINFVRDEVIIFSAVFTPDGAESFDHNIVVHLSFNPDRLAFVGEEVLLNRKRKAFCFKLIQSVPKFGEEHLFTILLQEFEVTICCAQEDRTVDLKEVLNYFQLMNFHPAVNLHAHESTPKLIIRSTVNQPG
jgi:hypothetical protein